jgi:hypothetical protein
MNNSLSLLPLGLRLLIDKQKTRLKKKHHKYKPGPVSAHPNLAGLS